MKTTDFAECISIFFSAYLPGQRGVSQNTIMSYRDTFKLVLVFSEERKNIRAERLTLHNFNSNFVEEFLLWLEHTRGNSISTCNQRLAAIHAFVKYIKLKKPEYLFQNQKILEIATRKKPQPRLCHMSPDNVQKLFTQIDCSNQYGRRDLALLTILYDAGARVQEVCDITVRDVRLQKPYTITLIGKGQKTRVVPIMENTIYVLKHYLDENKLLLIEKLDHPLFTNHQHRKLTRAGIAYILKKYCDAARDIDPLIPQRVSPHVLRHSKAMHMLQAGVNLIYIRDFLGHAHVETTEIYARADTEMKRAAIEKAHIRIETDLPDWTEDKSLMAFLTNICD